MNKTQNICNIVFLFSLFKDNKCESGAGSTRKEGKRKGKRKRKRNKWQA